MLCSVIVLRIGKTRVQAQCRVGLDNPIFRGKSDHLSAQLPIPTQLAKFSSRIPTPHNTTTAPIPLHLGSNNTDCCASAIALWTVVHGGGLDRCSREWNLHGKGLPPCPGPWQQQVSTSHRRSFDRPPCPVPRASSEISGISNSGWGPCTAPTQVQHVE